MTGIIANFRNRTLSRDGVTISCGPVIFRIVTALLAARCPLTTRELVEHVYGDDLEGGPDWADFSLRSMIAHARNGQIKRGRLVPPKLSILGLSIVAYGHQGYTIVVTDSHIFAEAAE